MVRDVRCGVRVGRPRAEEHVREPGVRSDDIVAVDAVPDVRLEVLVAELDGAVSDLDAGREPCRERC